MNFRYVIPALAGAVALCGSTLQPSTQAGQTELAWQSDYAAAQKVALQSGKPLFVVFR